MKKTKTQKGITLIALIITIVVLMILAVVTINSVKDGGIIQHAQNAAETYNTKADEENQALQNYSDYINSKTDPIAKTLKGIFSGQTTEDELIEQLKKDASIEDEDIEDLFELMAMFEEDGVMGFYLYETDKFYKAEPIEKDGEIVDFNISYGEESQYAKQYNYGRTLKELITELESIFVGKTVSEISEKNDAGQLEDFIKTNVPKIIDMDVHMNTAKTKVILDSVTWKDGEYELTISDKDNVPQTTWVLSGEDGIFNKVMINNAE